MNKKTNYNREKKIGDPEDLQEIVHVYLKIV